MKHFFLVMSVRILIASQLLMLPSLVVSETIFNPEPTPLVNTGINRINLGAEVGSIAADFTISPSGAATYSIPIELPAANGGVQPTLSLNYSSQGGDGLLGMGWALGGLSAITRCQASYATDGFKAGINFDSKDRYCLDGQRLILVSGDHYGAAGSEYRTEIDSFAKIIAYGALANSPSYFKVWTKAGEVLEYGQKTNGHESRFAPNKASGEVNNESLSWSINKLTDSSGNYMSFQYEINRQSATQLPKKILYAGHSSGQAPTAEIEFLSVPRNDKSEQRVAGVSLRLDRVINKIRIKNVKGVLVSEYRIDYAEQVVGRNAFHITGIAQCDGQGLCRPKTSFQHQGGTNAIHEIRTNSGDHSAPTVDDLERRKLIDINNDGLVDIYHIAKSATQPDSVYLQNTDASYSLVNTGIISGSSYKAGDIRFGDFNGDGKIDLFKLEASRATKSVHVGSKSIRNPNCSPFSCDDGRVRVSAPIMGGQVETRYSAIIYTGNGDGTFNRSAMSPSVPFMLDIKRPSVR
ncbi:MAG: SpvB/TcaC N-terminal domain-containing protein, partial [Gammaproteobacteria bacterium]|nr:SpvB/TcaC N-terminal domain-containing protein [Gammaproteobacteria bacterium]